MRADRLATVCGSRRSPQSAASLPAPEDSESARHGQTVHRPAAPVGSLIQSHSFTITLSLGAKPKAGGRRQLHGRRPATAPDGATGPGCEEYPLRPAGRHDRPGRRAGPDSGLRQPAEKGGAAGAGAWRGVPAGGPSVLVRLARLGRAGCTALLMPPSPPAD